MLPKDKFGRTVTMTVVGGQDVYVADDGSGNLVKVSFPSGTDQAQAYNSLEGQAPPGYVPPAPPLNQQYTQQQYGQILIARFNEANGARSLTPDQTFQIAQLLEPYFVLASTGALETLLAELPNIPVDGTLITQPLIDQFSEAIQAYLAGI